ncbi:MAG: TetR/AcrR family transcriptional regulator [Sphingobacteriales bacterium]|nr:MAG: TetR/AcrR family transcriptional regulator [Sphingobacteriales bacterium]
MLLLSDKFLLMARFPGFCMKHSKADDILATTQVTKGAFYYHFKNKDEMGLAIISEILMPKLTNEFSDPLQRSSDPLALIYDLMHHLLLKDKFMKLELGCPVSNLTQEMAPWNEAFSKALSEVTGHWEKVLTAVINSGRKSGMIREVVNPKETALFIMSGYWGIRNFGKLRNNKSVYKAYLRGLKDYLNSLR